jgi:hypothetical protein
MPSWLISPSREGGIEAERKVPKMEKKNLPHSHSRYLKKLLCPEEV